MWRRSLGLTLVLLLALVSILLNVVTNDVTGGSADAVPLLRVLRQWALPALAVLIVLFLGGQAILFLLDRPPQSVWSGRRPPYPGLDSFTEEDAGVFFGRDAEVRELLDRLSLGHAGDRFVPLVGPSGSGKSSLVHAGLLPSLASRRPRWVVLPTVVPEDLPIRSLASALAARLPGTGPEDLAARLAADPEALGDCLEQVRHEGGGRLASMVLVVDQAEELLTSAPAAERTAFLELLRAALRRDRRLWVVAALRSEFLGGFLAAGWADLFRHPLVLGPPSRAALFEIIERPAAQAGLRFAPGLVGRMVEDAGSGDALPMLAYTLQALYLRAGPNGTVTAADYEQLGGVGGALSDQADRVAAALRAGGARDTVIPTLLRFVSLDESGPIRRRVSAAALDAEERRVVDAFVAARLLTTDVEDGDTVVRLAHEALFRRWPPLRQAVEEAADTLRQRAQLERWALDWAQSGQRESYLLRGERLEAAQRAARSSAAQRELGLVAEFLEHSARVDRAAMARLADAVAVLALGLVERDPELATLLALAAVEECALTATAWRALLTAVVSPGLRVLRGHREGLYRVVWSPDGTRLASTSADRTVRLWDPGRGVELTALLGHEDVVFDVAWSPDGRRLATVSQDRTLRVWAAAGGAGLLTIAHRHRQRAVAWSPDGSLVAAGGEDGAVRIRDAESGVERCVLSGHEDAVRAVSWSPDGSLVATAAGDRAVRLWDGRNGALRLVLHGHAGLVSALAWSPHGDRLVSASRDGTARVWRPAEADGGLVLSAHEDELYGVDWSPDGTRIATAGDDRTVRVWDAGLGIGLAVLRGHESSVSGVSWSASRRLASSSEDGCVRVWTVDGGADLAVLRGHLTTVHAVAWSPDGRRLATASRDRTAGVWDAERGTELLRIRDHEGSVRGVAWSPGGRRLATASTDGTARVWDPEDGHCLLVLYGHEEAVRGVAWSPDGRRLATASADRTLRVWDARSGRLLSVLSGHRDRLRAVAWSPEGRRLAVACRDGSALVWDAELGLELAQLRGSDGSLRDVAWSPEGRRLVAVGDDGTLRVWDVGRAEQLAVLTGHEGPVRSVSWAPGSRLVASASGDRTVRTWDTERRTLVAIAGIHDDLAEAVAWSPEGRRIASGSRDRTVRVWDATAGVQRLIARAHSRVARSLTAAERRNAMLP